MVIRLRSWSLKASSTEFVLINPAGKEADWVDPVENFRETETYWEVDNGYFTYRFDKDKYVGYVGIVRVKGEA